MKILLKGPKSDNSENASVETADGCSEETHPYYKIAANSANMFDLLPGNYTLQEIPQAL